MGFPKEFVWGAAAAAYQIEGAAFDDGKGFSVWDQFVRKSGAVKNGDTGDVACNHYHCYPEDIAIMKELGIQAYRLSLSWTRILPEGLGTVNSKGLEFYERLVDQLLENGITPYITLFHWDYPLALHLKGGWLNPDSSDWFANYAKNVMDRLSDRVNNWFTFNENTVFITMGYLTGKHAPGVKLNLQEVLQINHNLLLAHGKAVQAMRKYSRKPCRIGMAAAVTPVIPASDNIKDVEAARKANFAVKADNLWVSGIWQDPIYLGDYSKEFYQVMEKQLPLIGPNDLKTIAEPVDFIGLNIYRGQKVKAGENDEPVNVTLPQGYARTAFDWPVVPESLYWGPKFYYERYHKPVIISENGLSNLDWISLDGKVHDPQRIDFTQRYLSELHKAAQDGVEVLGYFHWSLMDNFEWAEGYNQRFGLVYIDYPTQQRIIKDSGYWYQKVIQSGGDIL